MPYGATLRYLKPGRDRPRPLTNTHTWPFASRLIAGLSCGSFTFSLSCTTTGRGTRPVRWSYQPIMHSNRRSSAAVVPP